MREPLKFFVVGVPKGQPRVRAFVRGKHAGVYDPGTANEWKLLVLDGACKAFRQSGNTAPWEGPLSVSLTFYFPRPKSHFRANGELKPGAPAWHTSKPDRDNAEKAVLDTLTNLGLWRDDSQVCDGTIRKLYALSRCNVSGCAIEVKEAGVE